MNLFNELSLSIYMLPGIFNVDHCISRFLKGISVLYAFRKVYCTLTSKSRLVKVTSCKSKLKNTYHGICIFPWNQTQSVKHYEQSWKCRCSLDFRISPRICECRVWKKTFLKIMTFIPRFYKCYTKGIETTWDWILKL